MPVRDAQSIALGTETCGPRAGMWTEALQLADSVPRSRKQSPRVLSAWCSEGFVTTIAHSCFTLLVRMY